MALLLHVTLFILIGFCFSEDQILSDATTSFEKWLENFGFNQKLDIIEGAEGFGKITVAKNDIKSGETIITLPFEALMSSESARKSSIGFVFNDREFQEYARAPRTLLAIHILFEKKNPNSFFKPYLDMLPPIDKVDTTILWTESELEELRGSWLYDRTNADLIGLHEEYDSIFQYLFFRYPDLFTAIEYPFDEFKWAFSMIWSRGFLLDIGRMKEFCMVPMADMLNHGHLYETHFSFDNSKKQFKMIVHNSYDKGTEVYNNYGRRPNSNLLQLYGFVVKENPDNDLKLDVQLFPDQYQEFKERALVMHKLNGNSYPYDDISRLLVGGKISEPLMAYLRIKHFKVPPSKKSQFREELQKMNPFVKVSKGNEESCLSDILELCEKALQRFPTTLEEDQTLLQQSHLSPRQKMAIQVRMEEKSILKSTIEKLNKKKDEL